MDQYKRLEEYTNSYYEDYIAPLDLTGQHEKITEIIDVLKQTIERTKASSPDHQQILSAWMRGEQIDRYIDELEYQYKYNIIGQFTSLVVWKYGGLRVENNATTKDLLDFLNKIVNIFQKHLVTLKTSADFTPTRNADNLDENKLINDIAKIITEDPNITLKTTS